MNAEKRVSHLKFRMVKDGTGYYQLYEVRKIVTKPKVWVEDCCYKFNTQLKKLGRASEEQLITSFIDFHGVT